jgi:hypothetical protein
VGLLALCMAALAPLAATHAATISGDAGGLHWTARSSLVGVTSTGTVLTGGNPLYLPNRPQKNGVVGLLMDYGSAGAFVCSGSLLSDRRSIVTAGHCVSGGGGAPDANLVSTTAFFYGGPDDLAVYQEEGATQIGVSDYFVNPEYTGDVVDQNDIAVLRLADYAPEFATAYGLYTGEIEGEAFNIAGYGLRSTGGGSVGTSDPFGLGPGRLREGDNRYDFRLGDDDFGGFFTDAQGENLFGGTADIAFSYLSDFDNGLAANDASCLLAGDFGLSGPKYCNLGVGAREVGIAGGDSGGPGFVDGLLASVNSYGLTFCPQYGDIDGTCEEDGAVLNTSFGEFSGYVPIFLHTGFIQAAMAAPEPGAWTLLIVGFGMTGAALRRRKLAPTRV